MLHFKINIPPGISSNDADVLARLRQNLERADRYAREGRTDLADKQIQRASTSIMLLDMQTCGGGGPTPEDAPFLAAFQEIASVYVRLAQALGSDVTTDLYVFRPRRGSSLQGLGDLGMPASNYGVPYPGYPKGMRPISKESVGVSYEVSPDLYCTWGSRGRRERSGGYGGEYGTGFMVKGECRRAFAKKCLRHGPLPGYPERSRRINPSSDVWTHPCLEWLFYSPEIRKAMNDIGLGPDER